ncbi:MAG: methyltransferase domain-containing protein [Candidatus Bilamarchaeaceae archaeon]
MLQSQNYSIIADIYDFLYKERADVSYYLEESKKANGKVLEIGCGTGRVMLKLLEKGVDIEGLDISEKMLSVLKTKAKVKNLTPKVYLKDMRTFSLNKKYSLIIIPLRTFMHLSNDTERLKTLKKCYAHLLNSGKLIIHLYNPYAFQKATDFRPVYSRFFNLGSERIGAIWYERYIPSKEKIEYLIEITKKDKKIRKFFMFLYFVNNKKIEELLKKAGFKKVNIYSDFGKTEFCERKKVSEMIVVAHK